MCEALPPTLEKNTMDLEGYMSMAHTVWGISVATPEALYDLELGEVTRRLMEKITAYDNGTTQEVSELVRINGAN